MTLDSVMADALSVLAAWALDPLPADTRAYQAVLDVAGGEPAIVVVATHSGTPEVHVAIRTPAGVVVPIARVLADSTPPDRATTRSVQ